MKRTRQALAEYARDAGFGRVVRVHRPLRASWLAVTLIMAVILGAIGGSVVLFSVLLNEPRLWRWPVLGMAVLVASLIAARRWGPVGPREEQRWFVVAERGLVVLTWDSLQAALPWDAVSVERVLSVRRIVWNDGETPRSIKSLDVVGRRDLLAAVARGGRIATWTPRRVARTATVGMATALVAGFVVVPLTLDAVLGERPYELADLAEVCAGVAIGRAAPYEGDGPHPIAVYGDYSTPEYSAGEPPADTVQLVGCQRPTHGSAPEATASCSYEQGYTLTIRQGTYEITVREARTGRVVAVVEVDGERTTDCQDSLYVSTDDPSTDQEYVTTPEPAAYERALSTVTDGPTR